MIYKLIIFIVVFFILKTQLAFTQELNNEIIYWHKDSSLKWDDFKGITDTNILIQNSCVTITEGAECVVKIIMDCSEKIII